MVNRMGQQISKPRMCLRKTFRYSVDPFTRADSDETKVVYFGVVLVDVPNGHKLAKPLTAKEKQDAIKQCEMILRILKL